MNADNKDMVSQVAKLVATNNESFAIDAGGDEIHITYYHYDGSRRAETTLIVTDVLFEHVEH